MQISLSELKTWYEDLPENPVVQEYIEELCELFRNLEFMAEEWREIDSKLNTLSDKVHEISLEFLSIAEEMRYYSHEREVISKEIERIETGEEQFPGLYELYAIDKINRTTELPAGAPGPKPRKREEKIAAWKEWQIVNAHRVMNFQEWSTRKWGKREGQLIVPKSTFYSWPRT